MATKHFLQVEMFQAHQNVSAGNSFNFLSFPFFCLSYALKLLGLCWHWWRFAHIWLGLDLVHKCSQIFVKNYASTSNSGFHWNSPHDLSAIDLTFWFNYFWFEPDFLLPTFPQLFKFFTRIKWFSVYLTCNLLLTTNDKDMKEDKIVFDGMNTEPGAGILDYTIQSPQLIGSLGNAKVS